MTRQKIASGELKPDRIDPCDRIACKNIILRYKGLGYTMLTRFCSLKCWYIIQSGRAKKTHNV